MTDGLFNLDDPTGSPRQATPAVMTDAQRSQIRDLFAKIGVTVAREQFDIVAELTGVRITAVGQLTSDNANTLIRMLSARAACAGRVHTGNSWADREEDTWIDRL